jgi:hypothetical protein
MNNMYIAIVVAILIASFLIQLLVFGPRQFRKRIKLVSDYTTKRGYRLANPSLMQISSSSSARDILTNPTLKSYVKGSEGITDIEGLERGTDDPFAFTCTMRSKEVMIFELSVSSQRTDDKGRAVHYRVAKIAHEALPRFSLGRHSAVHAVENLVDKMTGRPKSDIGLDPRNFPEFAKHNWLKGPDSAAVLAFLSPEKITFLGNTKLEGVIATNSHYFVYFELGSLRSENDYDTFISTVEKLVANLL